MGGIFRYEDVCGGGESYVFLKRVILFGFVICFRYFIFFRKFGFLSKNFIVLECL